MSGLQSLLGLPLHAGGDELPPSPLVPLLLPPRHQDNRAQGGSNDPSAFISWQISRSSMLPLPPFPLGSPPYRIAEYEADSIGLRLMARAGYDPHAFTSILGKPGGDLEHQVGGGGGGASWRGGRVGP